MISAHLQSSTTFVCSAFDDRILARNLCILRCHYKQNNIQTTCTLRVAYLVGLAATLIDMKSAQAIWLEDQSNSMANTLTSARLALATSLPEFSKRAMQ